MIGPKFNLKKYKPIFHYTVNPKHEGHIVHSSGGSFGRAYGGHFGSSSSGSSSSSSSSSSSRNHHHHHSDNGDDNKVPVSYTDDSGHTVKFYVDKETAKDPSKVKEIGQKMISEKHTQISTSGSNNYHIGTWKDSSGKTHTVIKDSNGEIVAFTNPKDAQKVLEKFQSGKIQPKTVIYTKDETTGQWVSGTSSTGGISPQDVIYVNRQLHTTSADFDKIVVKTSSGKEIPAVEWARQNEPVRVGNKYIPVSNVEFQQIQALKRQYPNLKLKYNEKENQIVVEGPELYTLKVDDKQATVDMSKSVNLDKLFDVNTTLQEVFGKRGYLEVDEKPPKVPLVLQAEEVDYYPFAKDASQARKFKQIDNKLKNMSKSEQVPYLLKNLKDDEFVEYHKAKIEKEKMKYHTDRAWFTNYETNIIDKAENYGGAIGGAIAYNVMAPIEIVGGSAVSAYEGSKKGKTTEYLGWEMETIGEGVLEIPKSVGRIVTGKGTTDDWAVVGSLVVPFVATGVYKTAKTGKLNINIPGKSIELDFKSSKITLMDDTVRDSGFETRVREYNINLEENIPIKKITDIEYSFEKFEKNGAWGHKTELIDRVDNIKYTEVGLQSVEGFKKESTLEMPGTKIKKETVVKDGTFVETYDLGDKKYTSGERFDLTGRKKYDLLTEISEDRIIAKRAIIDIVTHDRGKDLLIDEISPLLEDVALIDETGFSRRQKITTEDVFKESWIVEKEGKGEGYSKTVIAEDIKEIGIIYDRTKKSIPIVTGEDLIKPHDIVFNFDNSGEPKANIKGPYFFKEMVLEGQKITHLKMRNIEIVKKEKSKGILDVNVGQKIDIIDLLEGNKHKVCKGRKSSKSSEDKTVLDVNSDTDLRLGDVKLKGASRQSSKSTIDIELSEPKLERVVEKTKNSADVAEEKFKSAEKLKNLINEMKGKSEGKIMKTGSLKTIIAGLVAGTGVKIGSIIRQKKSNILSNINSPLIEEKTITQTIQYNAEKFKLDLKLDTPTVELLKTRSTVKSTAQTVSLQSVGTAPTLTVPVPALRVKYPKLKIGNSGGNRWRRAITKTEKKQTFKVINLANLKIDI